MLLLIIGGGLAGLAALPHGGGARALASQPDTVANITDDSYFYGQSEPVYPSRTSARPPFLLRSSAD